MQTSSYVQAGTNARMKNQIKGRRAIARASREGRRRTSAARWREGVDCAVPVISVLSLGADITG
jgi:hypothetical protein